MLKHVSPLIPKLMLFYKTGTSPHKVFIVKHEPNKLSSNLLLHELLHLRLNLNFLGGLSEYGVFDSFTDFPYGIFVLCFIVVCVNY